MCQNDTKSSFEFKIHTTMYDGKARNAIIKYELKQFHEGNNDGNDDVENELVIDEDECGDGGDDSFFDFDNFDESENESEDEEELPKTIGTRF